jgi:tripartite-type tricarboxylate transporter receptor subunit TctC
MTMKHLFGALAAAVALACPAGSAQAQDYPTRPIRMIVPYAPGGSTDLTARLIAKEIEKKLGKAIVIENKPGAAAMIGLNELVTAKPDGYTIGMVNSGNVVQPIYGIARHNYATELQAIAQVGEVPFGLGVKADAPWKTIKDVVDYARANPKAFKYGITGFGNTAHLGPEHLALLAKVKMEPVNFDGGAPLLAAMLGGHIQGAGNNPVDMKEHVKAGRIRLLVVFGEKRLQDPVYKDVPTARESGYDVVVMLWQGVGAPKGIPDNVKKKLGDAFAAVLADPQVREQITALGLEPAPMGPDEFAKKWVSDQERMRKIVTDTGILDIVKSQTR